MKRSLQDLLEFDARLTQRIQIQTSQSPWWNFAVIFAHSGDSWLWAVSIGLVWLFTNGYWHRVAAVLELSIVVQALFVFGLKWLIRRERPAGEWGSIYRQFDPHSFPSGHATRVILLTVLAVGIGPTWFGMLIGVWAPLVCLSRVMTGVHYISDILGGILLGLVMGFAVIAVNPALPDLLPILFSHEPGINEILELIK